MGAVSALFSVIDKVLLEPLPYPEPDRLVELITTSPLGQQTIASIPQYIVWRDSTTSFSSIAAYDINGPDVRLTTTLHPQSLKTARVSAGFFQLFGARLFLGHTFSSREDAIIISDRLWRLPFRADPNILGRTILLDQLPHRVIAVLASDAHLPSTADAWLPLAADNRSVDHIGRVQVVARLKRNVSLDQAQQDVASSLQVFLQRFPPYSDREAPLLYAEKFTAIPLRDAVVGDVRPALYLLIGAVAFVLAIACANAASLLLARAHRRTREIAVRLALGAQRKQVVLQLLTESALLALAGGAAGLLLGFLGVRQLLAISPGDLPRIGANGAALSLDWRIFAFTLVLSLLIAILCGLVPAWSTSGIDISLLVKDTPLQTGISFRRARARSLIVITQIALSLVLLVGAGLLIRTFIAKRAISRGFDERNVVTLTMSLSNPQFNRTARVAQLVRSAQHRIEALDGITALAATSALPLTPTLSLPFTILNNDHSLVGRYDGTAAWRSVSPHYFQVFQIRLLRGRMFTNADDEKSASVVLINRAMLKQYWREIDANPITDFITFGKEHGSDHDDSPRQIIGVVADVRDSGLDNEPAVYIPIAQVKDRLNARNNRLLPLTWTLRTNQAPPAALATAQQELAALSGGQTLGRLRTMHEVIAASSARARFYLTLLTTFAVIALLLAATGLYGLLAYSVEQRSRELAIRSALGATAFDIQHLVAWQTLQLTLWGTLAGIPLALALARLTIGLIFGIKSWDPVVLALVAFLLAAVALVAAYLPSLRASRANPAAALRF